MHNNRVTSLEGAADMRTLTLIRKLNFRIVEWRVGELGAGPAADDKATRDALHRIQLLFSGGGQVAHNGQMLDLPPGQACFLPGKTPVEQRCRQGTQALSLAFRCEWLPGVDPLLDWSERKPVLLGAVDASVWQPWLQPGWSPNANDFLRLQGQLQYWMAGLLPNIDRLIGWHIEKHTRFEQVFAKIEENCGATLTVRDLAQIHGMRAAHFSAAFSAAIGLSPKDYLSRRINQEAVELILSTDLSVRELAKRLQFSSQYYFSRFFRKHNGLSPAHYRRRFRTGGRDQDNRSAEQPATSHARYLR